MKDTKHKQTTRRKALKNIALGGGVLGASQIGAEKWVKPVVDSIVLPAHAATTDSTGASSGGVTPAPLLRFSLSLTEVKPSEANTSIQAGKSRYIADQAMEQLQDLLVPSAQAGEATTTEEFYLGQVAGSLYHFKYVRVQGGHSGGIVFTNEVEGDISIGQTVGMVESFCGQPGRSYSVTLVSATAGGTAVLNMSRFRGDLILNSAPNATPPASPGECIDD